MVSMFTNRGARWLKGFRLGLGGRLYLGIAIFLVLLLLSAGLSMYSLADFSGDMQRLLKEKDSGIRHCQSMLSALETQRFSFLGQLKNSGENRHDLNEATFRRASELFEEELRRVRLGIEDEPTRILTDSLVDSYAVYRTAALLFFQDTVRSGGYSGLTRYVEELTPQHIVLTAMVNRLLSIHQMSIYEAQDMLARSPERALRPGLIIAGVGLLFAAVLIYLVYRFYLLPLRRITLSVNQYANFKRYKPVPLLLNGELLDLRKAIDRLIFQLRARGGAL